MVPGEGVQPSRLMVVGEAPGRKEVEAGRPFVGPAGQLLDTALKALGVPREEIYITNVCKELPLTSEGKIRRPYPEEIEAWKPILEAEVESTAPAAILALGRTAVDVLTGTTGVPFGSRIENVYTAWHPAYVLRLGGDREEKNPSMFVLPSSSDYSMWLEQLRPWAEELWVE